MKTYTNARGETCERAWHVESKSKIVATRFSKRDADEIARNMITRVESVSVWQCKGRGCICGAP